MKRGNTKLMDKLESNLCIRLPLKLKVGYEALSNVRKKRAHLTALLAIAKEIHDSKFDPKEYGIDVEA